MEGFHFLVVDDQEFVRHIVRQALISAGVKDISAAINGEEALELIKARAAKNDTDGDMVAGAVKPGTISRVYGGFDCVITDFNMEPLTGLHVLKGIRTGESGAVRDTPVAILTGHSDDHLVASALALDANAFVIKPVSRLALLSRVVRAMKRPVELKDANRYSLERIPDTISSAALRRKRGAGTSPSVLRDKPKTAEPAQEREVCVPIKDIEAGSTLLMDVKSSSGTVMLSRGTVMNSSLVEKLLDLKDVAGVSEEVWIRREA